MNSYSTFSCRACESWGRSVVVSVELIASTVRSPSNDYIREMTRERLCQPCFERLQGAGLAVRSNATA